jgi:hypothetical protein
MLNGFFMGFQPNGNTLDQLPDYYDAATLFVAGATDDGNSLATGYLTKVYSAEQQQAWIKDLHARSNGTQVLMCLMDSSSIHWNQVDLPAYAQSVKSIAIDQWGCDGIDIDLESGMPSDVWAKTFIALARALRTALGPKGTPGARLTMTGYIPSLEEPVLSAIGSELDWFNTMAYWNDAGANEALFNTYHQYVDQVNLGIGVSYQGGQSTPLSSVAGTAAFAAGNGAGMMLYAINNDCPAYTDQPQWTWSDTINKNYSSSVEVPVAGS